MADLHKALTDAAQEVITAWDQVATVEPCSQCKSGGFVSVLSGYDDRRMDLVTGRLRAMLAEHPPTAPDLLEQGRRLASERDDLIAAGVDPADLVVPLAPLDAATVLAELDALRQQLNQVRAFADRMVGRVGVNLRALLDGGEGS